MLIVIAIMLGVAGLSFVLYPLYLPALVKVPSVSPTNEQTASGTTMIGEREQAARSALQEVELDYQLGNISDEDYNTLRERYVRRALHALKSRYEQNKKLSIEDSADEANSENENYDSDIDEMIENELRRLREQGTKETKENDAAN